VETARLLHVDDDPGLGELVAEFLERESDDLDVVTETSAADGLDRLAADDIDCVVSDYDMPEIDGLAFLERVRAEYPDLPFILFTGKGSEAVASEAIAGGATDYLQKESGTEQYELLANRAENAIEQYRSEQRAAKQERVNTLVSDINQALVRAASREEIEREVCRRFAGTDLYEGACVARVDADAGQVATRTTAGATDGLFDQAGSRPDGGGATRPVVETVEDREVRVLRDPFSGTEEPGSRGAATVPLVHSGNCYGVFLAVTQSPAAVDGAEREMLQVLGDDIAHAIHAERIQDHLRATATRLEALFENSPDMIVVHDAAGTIVDTNSRLRELLGYEEYDLLGEGVWDLDVAVTAADGPPWIGLEPGESYRAESEYERADGSLFPVEVHVKRLDIDGRTRFLIEGRDISDRREREQELNRYEDLVSSVPVPVFRTKSDGEILEINEAFARQFGADSVAEMAAHEATEIWVDVADRNAIIADARREGTVRQRLSRMQTLDGDPLWIEVTMTITEGDEEPYLVGICHDVTDRERRKQAFERTNALLSTLFETLPVGVIAEDESRNVLAANERFVELFGLEATPGELVDRDCGQLVQEAAGLFADPDGFLERVDDLVTRREPSHGETLLLADGRSLERSYEPVELPEGKGHVWLYRDVTDREDRERRLRETTSRLEALFEQSPDMIALLDSAGTVVDANRRLREELGYDRGSLRGRPVWTVDSDVDADGLDQRLAAFEHGERRKFEGTYERADGSTFPVEIHLLRLDVDGEDRFMAIGRDITDRRAYEQELERQNERLEEFASVVSHDLRSPLNVASGRLELARETVDSDHLDEVARAHDRMGSLIEDLLALAEDGGGSVEPSDVDLAALSEQCWRTVGREEVSLRTETDRRIRADRSRLRQLLENLLRNSVQHGDTTVTVGTCDEGFYVADDGPGILDDRQADVFDTGHTTSEDGTGIGLRIVEQVARAHGWSVCVTDSEDGGARVDVTGVEFVD